MGEEIVYYLAFLILFHVYVCCHKGFSLISTLLGAYDVERHMENK